MVRFINCIRKKADISQQEFREFWHSKEFDALIEKIVSVSGATKSSKTLTLQVEANMIIQQDRSAADPFDGVIEYFWPDAASLMDIYASAEGRRVLEKMAEFQEQFIDLENSTGFFTEGP